MSFYIYETKCEGVDGVGKYVATQEQFDALEYVTGVYPNNVILNIHEDGWKNDSLNALNGLSQYSLAVALLIGYEVEPSYKVGDWVVNMGRNLIYKVSDKDATPLKNKHVIENHRHATPSEIKQEKERRVWKLIGREVGEFFINDAYMHSTGITYTVDLPERITAVKTMYEKGRLKGFYPAESFVSFEGGDKS